ncbi:MAG TPA: sulfatase-like hydrolase/transferase [Vicinamibacterales bacterium]|nr:sulfatase-like hydrolase/transferase [Vicinamibacterales bacterium]
MSRPLRFTFIIFLAALSTTLAAVGGWRFARASAPVSGPIIVISIDTLRADHLPAYGYRTVKTPAIDALAADGVVFDRAYSHAPQTLPAHAALLSGQLPFETGVRDNVGFSIKPGERLLPQMLRDRGFTTAGVVSAYVLRKETGIAQGFDFFDGEMPPASPELSIGQVQRDGSESEQIAEHWLESIGTARAFLFLHLYEPHKPYAPPERFSAYAPYDGEIAYADEIVGRLVRYLKSHQLYDRSTVILLSDHGEGLGDHGEQEHGLFVYDEAIHVPLIIKQESNVGSGRRVGDLVQHIDLVPTILDLVKAPIPGGLHGRSLKPVLDGTGRLDPTTVYAEALYARYHFGWSELTAVTDERYRYIKAPREELYDLEHDAREQANLAAERPQARQALRGALDRVSAGAAIHAPHEVSAEARERLQALGYVGLQGDVAVGPGETLPDPKDKREILEHYREAVDLAAERRWPQAIALLQDILRDDPEMADVWAQLAVFATRIDRYDLAVDAYKRHIELQPEEPTAYIGTAAALLKLRRLDEAREYAQLAADVAVPANRRARASAHEMLAKIALARHDPDAAREEARLAREQDMTLPLPTFIEARLLYDDSRYADALPLFQQAISELKKSTVQITELHFYTADTLGRLERYAEAEAQFLEELRYFPQNIRARAGLAMLYQANARPDEAEQVLRDMTRITPTPESYALATRLYTMFGNRRQAEALRAESRRAFPPIKPLPLPHTSRN